MEVVPFLSLAFQHAQINQQVKEAMDAVYKRNWFVLGQEVERFESEYAGFSGTPFCIGVGNGSDALALALMSAGVGSGDEVILPAHTYLATWLSVSRTGARIVPVDADSATFNIDKSRIREFITNRTKVIVPVHMYGHPCDMTAVDEIARQHNLTIIEDNAQAHGASWRQKRTGSFGHVNATSFYPSKNLGALGDGGAVTTFDKETDSFVRRNRNYGLREKNVGVDIGLNSRLDEVQAAVLRIKLRHLDDWNNTRRELAAFYLSALQGVGDLILPLSDKEAYHVYHLFVIRTNRRDELKSFLFARGIETMTHYPVPPHLQPVYGSLGFRKGQFPIAERIAETSLSLPLWPGLKKTQLEWITESIRRFYQP